MLLQTVIRFTGITYIFVQKEDRELESMRHRKWNQTLVRSSNTVDFLRYEVIEHQKYAKVSIFVQKGCEVLVDVEEEGVICGISEVRCYLYV